ncbi:MAG: T9SS type A sorting domain-containing protein [Cryomorphaceae bacterium]
MKKLYYLFMFMGMASVAVAQSAKQVPESNQLLKHSQIDGIEQAPTYVKPVVKPVQTRGEVIWEDDFSETSNWTSFNSSTPTPIDWEIITDNTVAPFGGLNPMMLPTADNGFGFINADVGGDGSQQNATLHIVDPIDLTGVDNVAVQFYHVTRNFASTYSVVYSLDAGDTWNTVPVASAPPSGNTDAANTSNPELAIVDLSAQIGNQPQVWIGFRYVASWGWFWAVDDVSLAESPDNYITLKDAWYDEWATIKDPDVFNGLFGPDIDMVQSYEYAFYKADQVRPLTFTADVQNLGSQPQTNVTFTAVLTGPDGTPHEFTEVLPTLAPGERTFMQITDAIPPPFNLDNGDMAQLGEYTVTFAVDQDEEDFLPEDNIGEDKSFRVDEEFISHLNNASYGYFTTLAGAGYEAFSRYAFHEETEIDFIEFALTTGPVNPEDALFESISLDVFTGSVYANQDAPNDALESLFVDEEGNSSVTYFITDASIFNTTPVLAEETNWVRVMFPEAITVTPEFIYNASITVGSAPDIGAEDFLWPLAAGSNSSTASHYFGPFDGDPEVSLFIGGTAFAIRMGNSTTVNTVDGTEPVTFRLGQNYPNPVNGTETLIDWELLEPAQNITFTVHDMNGRVVEQRDLGDRPAGKQETLRVNTNLAAGVYQYSLIVGNYRAVRKMVVTK